ncbi:MAG: transporter substrate-binding domain-containing protein [Pseudodesulfovibrio sp.]
MAFFRSRPAFMVPLVLAALILAAPLAAQPQSPEQLTYLTEEYYPFNYADGGTVRGVSADLLRMVWNRLGVQEQSIEILPWARAYELARHQPGTVLFGMARTPERESMFRWAGPIFNVRFVLIAKKSKQIQVRSLDQLNGYCIGTVRGDVAHTLLAPHLRECTVEAVADMKQNVRKLVEDRLDMVAYEEHSWPGLATRMGVDPDQFETVFLLRETPIYFAFHIDTDPSLLAAFQEALDSVTASQYYPMILNTYLK